MAAGIDVSVAGNRSADSLDPLVRALDQYSAMLQGVVNALQQIKFPDFPEFPSIKEELDEFIKQLTGPKARKEKASEVIESPAIASNVPAPETTKAPSITPPPLPENSSPFAPIKEALGSFKSLGNIGSIASTVAKGLGGLAVAVDIGTKVVEEVFDLIGSALQPLDDAIKALGDALQPLADVISTTLQVALKPFMTIIQLIGKLLETALLPTIAILRVVGKVIETGLLPFVVGIKFLGKMLELVTRPLQSLDEIFEVLYESIDALLAPIDALIALIDWLTGGMTEWIRGMVKSSKAQKDAIKSISEIGKSFKDTVKNLLSNPLEMLPRIISEIREAVDLFNPGAMIDFDLAMRDLQAVFGEFFAPIVKEAAIVVRSFADTLRPILLAVAPIFQKLIGAISDQLLANISLFADTLALAVPALVEYVKAQVAGAERQLLLMEKWRRADTLFKMIAFPFEMMLKTNKGLKADIKEARKNEPGFMNKNALPGAQGLAVAYNASFKGIADIARESMLQAFIGTSSMAALKNAKKQKAEDNVADLDKIIKEAGKNAFLAALEEHDKRKPANAGGLLNIFGGGR